MFAKRNAYNASVIDDILFSIAARTRLLRERSTVMTYPLFEELERTDPFDDRPIPQYVFRFDEVESAENRSPNWDAVRGLLG